MANDYEYIIGARIKNESKSIQNKILSQRWADGDVKSFNETDERL
nr:hypothetical protein [Taylorella equigenitalis]